MARFRKSKRRSTQTRTIRSATRTLVFRNGQGKPAAAEDAFKRAVELAPKSAATHLNLGNFYWATGRGAEAEREFERARDGAEIGRHQSGDGGLLHCQRKAKEAEPYLKAYAAAQGSIRARLALATTTWRTSRLKDAMRLTRTDDENPMEALLPAELRLASIDFAEGRRPEANRRFEEILKRLPRDRGALEAESAVLRSPTIA